MRSILFLYHYYLESILSPFYHLSITFLAIYTSMLSLFRVIYQNILGMHHHYSESILSLFYHFSITFLAILYQHMLLLFSVYTITVQSSAAISMLLPLWISSIGLWHCLSRLYCIVFYTTAFFLFSYILCLVFSVVFMCILDARIC